MYHTLVKYILFQTDTEGRRKKWITKIQECDLEINPTKLVKGQGLAKLLAKSNQKAIYINLIVQLIEEEKLRSVQETQDDTMKVNPKFQELY